jgi:hypothetical protein
MSQGLRYIMVFIKFIILLHRGTEVPGAREITSATWPEIIMHPQYEIFFMLPFWRPEFFSGF